MTGPLIRLLLEKTHDDHSSVVSVLMFVLEYISLIYLPISALCKLQVLRFASFSNNVPNL